MVPCVSTCDCPWLYANKGAGADGRAEPEWERATGLRCYSLVQGRGLRAAADVGSEVGGMEGAEAEADAEGDSKGDGDSGDGGDSAAAPAVAIAAIAAIA